MNKLLLTTAVAALILAAPAAFADDHHDHGGGGGGQHESHDSAPKGSGGPKMGGGDTGGSHTDRSVHTDRTIHTDHTTGNGLGHDNHFSTEDRHVKSKSNNRMDVHTNIHVNNSHTNGHINFNRHNVSASHHFHYRGGAYRWPGGYHYQRWSYGMMLPSVFWAQDYWIDDYSDYGLAYPPEGAVWVRYGNDALLVDRESGEILEVVYGQFY